MKFIGQSFITCDFNNWSLFGVRSKQFLFAADRDTKLNNIARFIIYKTSIQSIYCPSSSFGIAILTFNGFCIRPFSFIVIPFIVVLLQFVEVYKFRAT